MQIWSYIIHIACESASSLQYTYCISEEGYDPIQKSVFVMKTILQSESTNSLSLLQGPLWTEGEPPDRVLSLNQIEYFDG